MLECVERHELQEPCREVTVLMNEGEDLAGILLVDVEEVAVEEESGSEVLAGALGLRADGRRRAEDDDEDYEDEDDEYEEDDDFDDDMDDDVDDFDDDDADDDFDDDFVDDDED